MKYISIFTLFAVCTLLSGCLGDVLDPKEDPTTFYTIKNLPAEKTSDFDGSVGINFVASGYLTRSQITSLNKDSTVRISEFNRWVEIPENLLARAFATAVAKNAPKATVFLYPEISCLDGKHYDVRITITDCIGSINGTLNFSGRWIVIKNGKGKAYNFSKTVSSGKGYSGYVDAISKCIAEVSAEIAKSI